MTTIAWVACAWGADSQLVDPVRPISQRVSIALDPAKPETQGDTTLVLDVRADTPSFLLSADEIVLGEASIRRFGKRPRPVAVEQAGRGLVRITPEEPLTPGTWELDVAFQGRLHDQAYGLYRFDVDGAWYVASQFEPDDARTAWPCFDEPGFRIPFTMHVTVPDGNQVIGNSPVASRNVNKKGLTVQLEPTPPVPTYALALLVGPYVPREVDGVELRSTVWTVKGHERLAEGIAEELPPVMRSERGWFGTDPPYEKLDLVLVPEFAYGAMENPGAMVFAEAAVPPTDVATPDELEEGVNVVAHELAHLWFGDWVTMTWWDNLWLNESFAEWMSRRTVHELYPEYRGELTRVARLHDMLAEDANAATLPLRTDVDPNAVFESANFAVYGKGEALLDMIEAWTGPDAFQKGLRSYLAAHANGNARAADLFLALSDASGVDVASVLDDLLDTPGAPRVRLEVTADGLVVARKEALGLAGAPAPDGGPWVVPVRMRIGRPDGSTEIVVKVLRGATETWDLGPVAWLHPAADGIGYYAWTLDDGDLGALLAVVPSLSPAERLALVRALALDRAAGERTLAETLARLSAFDRETEPDVLLAVAKLYGEVRLVEVVGEPGLEVAAHRYLRDRLRPMLDTIGREGRKTEAPDKARLRLVLRELLARAGDGRARAEGLEIGRKALQDFASVAPEDAAFGLAVLAEDGPPDTVLALLHGAEAEADPARRAVILRAAGRAAGEAGIRKAVGWAAGAAPYSEAIEVLFAVGGREREAERNVALAAVAESWELLAAKFPPVNQRDVAYFAAGCSTARVDRAQALFGERAIPGFDQQLAAVRAGAEACLARVEADLPGLRSLLLGAP